MKEFFYEILDKFCLWLCFNNDAEIANFFVEHFSDPEFYKMAEICAQACAGVYSLLAIISVVISYLFGRNIERICDFLDRTFVGKLIDKIFVDPICYLLSKFFPIRFVKKGESDESSM